MACFPCAIFLCLAVVLFTLTRPGDIPASWPWWWKAAPVIAGVLLLAAGAALDFVPRRPKR